ncbi:conserved hypothetical protein [Ureaplasma urealyticum serovar 2 str. ATCC 27814]|uniref:aromatic motif membrane protein n=1 Tax=Ureaplasma urealyticum TaxID=2130 RepID=UPI0001794110|nr:aromatic motif membrane protein [Ureaplasma urealyticum]EEH01856.1 conserved hypothetical protein [Ureaplasma urealyticum serovar 2 str. ATCC 27814]
MKKQKRKILISSLLSVFLITSLTVELGTGLSLVSKNQSKITSKIYQETNFFVNDLSKQLFLDVFNQNKAQLNTYIYDQNNVSDQQLLDLKFALTLLNPNRLDISDDDAISIMKNIAKRTIFESLANNWYWFFTNLNALKFAYTPYKPDFYAPYKNEKQDFSGSLILNKVIDINKPLVNYVKVKQKTFDQEVYHSVDVYYLQFGDHLVLRLLKFNKKNHFDVRFDTDLFQFDQKINDLKSIATQMQTNIDQQREKSFEKDVANYKNDYEENLDENQQFDQATYQQGLDRIKQKYNETNNFNFLNVKKSFFQKFSYEMFLELKDQLGFKRYVLRNVNQKEVGARDFIQKEYHQENKINSKPNQQELNHFQKYIDHNLDINIHKISKEAYVTQKIIKNLLLDAFNNDDAQITNYLTQQNNKEYQTKLIKQLIEFSNYFKSQKMAKDSLEYKQKLKDYEQLFSQNWYFILMNLNHFELSFNNWFTLPKQTNPITKEIVEPSKEYLQRLTNLEPYEDYYFINNYLDKKQEGDTSILIGSFKDLYITKNKSIFNIKIDFANNKNRLNLNPLVYFFPKTKNKLSIDLITSIFHQAIFHQSKEYYKLFETDMIDKYEYGIPAQMLLLWKE